MAGKNNGDQDRRWWLQYSIVPVVVALIGAAALLIVELRSDPPSDLTPESLPDVDNKDADTPVAAGTPTIAETPFPSGLISWWSPDKHTDDIQGDNTGNVKDGRGEFVPGKNAEGFRSTGKDSLV